MNEPSLHTDRLTLRRLIRPFRVQHAWGILALLFVNSIELSLPLLVQYGVESIAAPSDHLPFTTIGLIYFFAVLVQALLRHFWRRMFIFTSFDVAHELRHRLFERLLRLDLNFFNSSRVGDLISLGSHDVETARRASGLGVLLLWDTAINFVLIPALLFYKSPLLTVIVLAPLLILPWLTASMGRLIEQTFQKVQDQHAVISGVATDNITNIRTIKSFCREKGEIEGFRKHNEKLVSDSLTLARIEAIFLPATDSFIHVAVFLALMFGGWLVLNDRLTVGEFVAFHLYVFQLSWPMVALGQAISLLNRGRASINRINRVVTETPKIIDPIHPRRPSSAHLTLKSVRIRYRENFPDVLKDISLDIPVGTVVGVTGPVGSGKSTLLMALCRLIDPTEGSVQFGGIDLRELSLSDIRSQVAFMPQEPFVASGTVAENIAFYQEGIDRNSMLSTVEVVLLRSHIEKLAGGLDASLGERGLTLSGGQRQRLTLARTLLRPCAVLLLDDPFSNVDLDTETLILTRLSSYLRGKTTLLASQRLTTLRACDRVLVLEEGSVTGYDSPERLLKTNGFLRSMADLQRAVGS